MKRLLIAEYGSPDVIGLVEGPQPTARGDEVVVEVHALALNPKDVLVRKGKLKWAPGVRLPLVLCHDLAGVVVQAGPMADLAVGTQVYGWFEALTGGAGAERVALSCRHLAPMPSGLSMAEAASVPLAALTSLMALRDHLRVQPGDRVVVNGASGGVGVFAVPIAKILGAHVTAICSARNADLVRELGADEHVDYAATDPATLRDVDAFFDVFGSMPWRKARPTLSRGGRYCTTIPRPDTFLRGGLARLGWHRAHLVLVRSRREDLQQLTAWLESGRLRPVIDRELPWQDCAEGHRLLETKRTRGKIVLRVQPEVDGEAP